MFVGHLGVGLALKKVEPKINVGWLLFASLLLDLLLGIFVLTGLEQVHIPQNFARIHYLTFTFPYSHGLLAAILWSTLAFIVVRLLPFGKSWGNRAAFVIALAVFAHFLCDVIEHVPEMPLVGPNSPMLGLGLWQHMSFALGLEIVLAIAGYLFYVNAGAKSRVALYGMALFMGLLALATLSQAFASAAPEPVQLTTVWIVEPFVIGGIALWLDRQRTKTPRGASPVANG